MNRTTNFFRITDTSPEFSRTLAQGVEAQIYSGTNAMVSVVRLSPRAESGLHSHPEEQWGILLEGSGTRIQEDEEVAVTTGDFWRTPGGVPHAFRAGETGALIVDIFSPPRDEYRKDTTSGATAERHLSDGEGAPVTDIE